ncbi:MAG: hypothetical protein HOO91_17680 [Bacteroidales bacterium]|nr:hypothetical protein [Bacteroidales bacterium]
MNEIQDWSKEIRKLILDVDDLILFNESIGCLENNFLRSSYIITWISLIESLKRKIYLLSSLGDKNAEEAIKKIEQNEEQNNSVDKIIIEESKLCGIVESIDFSTLKYLWEQRCIFAHPYKKQPEIEDVKHIIFQSIKLSLGKELLFNKSYLSEITENIVSKPFFITSEKEKLEEYAKKVVLRTPQNLYPFFFKTLLHKIGTIKDDESKRVEQIKLRVFIVETLKNAEKDLEDTVWGLEHRAINFPFECFIGFISVNIWSKIPERIKEILISYIEVEQNMYNVNVMKLITKTLIEKEILEEKYKIKFYKYLSNQPFESVIEFYGNNKVIYERIVNELNKHSYLEKNNMVDYLYSENAVKVINSLDFQKQFSFGRLIRESANNGHFKSQHLIGSIIKLNTKYAEYVIGGLAFGCIINNQDGLILDYWKVKNFIIAMNLVSNEIQEFVYDKVFLILDGNKADEWDKTLHTVESIETDIFSKISSEGIEMKGSNKEKYEILKQKTNNYFA